MNAAVILAGEEQTRALGRALAHALRPGDVVALVGDLGAGKTTLSQAIGRGLGVPEGVSITSPTYTLLRTYKAPIPLNHLDLYRLGSEDELADLGFDELVDGEGVTLVEWADRFPHAFPVHTLWLTLEWIDDARRRALLGPQPLPPRFAAALAMLAP